MIALEEKRSTRRSCHLTRQLNSDCSESHSVRLRDIRPGGHKEINKAKSRQGPALLGLSSAIPR